MSVYNINGEEIVDSTGLSNDVKDSLLKCFRNVAWIDANSDSHYGELREALYDEPEPEPEKKYYTKWSTTPQDDTWGKLYITTGISVQEAYGTGKDGNPPGASINNARAAIHTSSDYSDYKIKYASDQSSQFPTNVDLYAIELPPKTTGFTASFGVSTGSCFYVFKYNETDDEYYYVSSYTNWYQSSQVVSGLDSNSKYIICGTSKSTSQQAITITTTQLS